MSESPKPKVTVSVYRLFPPKGKETARNEVTLEQVQKYLSGKPLRFGPQRQTSTTDPTNAADRTDPRFKSDQPADPGTP